jgi:ABC-type oligopeptide transport system substrate-binding subunit
LPAASFEDQGVDRYSNRHIAYNEANQKEWAKKLVRLMADECLVIPLYLSPAAYVIQPYVHTTYYKEMMVARKTYDEWMEKH